MIRLFGAVHGGYTKDILLRRTEIELEPTFGLERRLRELPPNSRVGIENLSPEDWQEAKEHLRELSFTNGLGAVYQSSNRYWERVAQICNLSGHEIVWLEDKATWFRYNHDLVEAEKVQRKYDELHHEEAESERDYFRKLVLLNEELHRAQIKSDKTHLLDRDETILQNVASKGCDAVVAGIGHTDAWVLNKDEILNKYGIEFGTYSTDEIADPQRFTLRFIEDATPNPNRAYDFTGIRRAINLLERGKLTDENPDWVGIWDVHEPSKGYFELFMEQQNDGVESGRIEDCLGTARFEGAFTPRSVRFVKKYGVSTKDAIKSDIIYQTQDADYDREMHQGVFRTDRNGSVFYIEKPNGNSPLQMAFSWFDLNHDDESGQRRLF